MPTVSSMSPFRDEASLEEPQAPLGGAATMTPIQSPFLALVEHDVSAKAAPVTVAFTAEHLEGMRDFLRGQCVAAAKLVTPSWGAGGRVPAAARSKVAAMLSQRQQRQLLLDARTAYDTHLAALAAGSADGTRLRVALLGVLDALRESGRVAVANADALDPLTRDTERGFHADLIADLIDADPFTSAGLLGTPAFGPPEARAGEAHERFTRALLDDLIRELPGARVTPGLRDRNLRRMIAGLERTFVTIAPGRSGKLGVHAIARQDIAERHRRVLASMQAAMKVRPPQLRIVRTALAAYQLAPEPLPDVTAVLGTTHRIAGVDTSHVPPTEAPYVRRAVLAAAESAATGRFVLEDVSWSVALPVRRRGKIVLVRYELIFDAARNVRAERLGDAVAREVDPAFARLSAGDKRKRLVADFRLAAVEDASARWSAAELDQLRAAYELVPARYRPLLGRVTVVRDRQDPVIAANVAVMHGREDLRRDRPSQRHGLPHMHYYDAMFPAVDGKAVGAAGAAGPGGDWTVVHELHHVQIFRELTSADLALAQADARIQQALARLRAAAPQGLPSGAATQRAHQAIDAFTRAATAAPKTGDTADMLLGPLRAARGAVVARDVAHKRLAANVAPAAIQAAADVNAAYDSAFAASQTTVSTFVELAARFGFWPFTEYARRAGPTEWLAETFALFVLHPTRLSLMSRAIFRWIEAGMPRDPNFKPAP